MQGEAESGPEKAAEDNKAIDIETKPGLDWSRYRLWIAVAIFLVSLVFRLAGIGWGLKNDLHNQSYHPDEEVNWRASQQVDPLKLKFIPGSYSYGTLYLSTMRIAGDIANIGSPQPENPETDWAYIARGEMAGRIVSALAGSMLAAVLFWLGCLLFGEIGGITSGLIAAFSPGLVMHSRFATVDVFATLWIALAALSAVKLLTAGGDDKRLWKWVILSGVFAGLAAGTKYTGGAAILMAIVALLFVKPKDWLMKSAVGVLVTVGVFVITTPGILLDKDAFWRDFKFEQQHVATGHGLVFFGTEPGYLYQLSNLFLVVGLISVALGLGGLIWAAVRRERWAFVLLSFFLISYVLIGGAAVKFARYCFPLTPALAIGAGYAVAQGFAAGRKGAWLVGAGMLGIAGIPGQGGLIGTINTTALMLEPDSRDAAAQVLKNAATETTTVGLPEDPWFWSVPLFPDSTMVRMIPFRVRDELRQAATKPKVLQFVGDDPKSRTSWDPRLLTQLKPDYVAFTDLENKDLDRLQNSPLELPSDFVPTMENYKAFMTELTSSYQAWHLIGPQSGVVEDLRYVQPTVYLWKRK